MNVIEIAITGLAQSQAAFRKDPNPDGSIEES
jgi:hypothetical protein